LAIAELSDSEDNFLDLWTRPSISFNGGNPAIWLSDDEDEANKAPGRIFELAVDWFAWGAT